MPKLNPRLTTRPRRFAQVSGAVLAGMAAMFCLQNVLEFRRESALPAAPADMPRLEQARPERDSPPAAMSAAPPLAASNMLLKPESGYGSAGAAVVAVAGEERPFRYEPPPRPPPAPPPAPPKKPFPRLEERPMQSRFASGAVRSEWRSSSLTRRSPAQAAQPPAAPAHAAPVPAPSPVPPTGASWINPIEKSTPPPENINPSRYAPPERIFWTSTRRFSFAIALTMMILGIIFFVYASGIHDGPPERAEGEL